MLSYTPVWSFIVDSSLWRESDLVVKVFMTMMAKQDPDHVVRGSAYNIGEWAKKSESEAIEALKVLSSPDTKRIEPQPFEGRRIERVSDGWLILNGDLYQRMMVEWNRRAYQRRKQAEYRAQFRDEMDGLTEAQKAEFLKNKAEAYAKRRKTGKRALKHEAQISGAKSAIADGLNGSI